MISPELEAQLNELTDAAQSLHRHAKEMRDESWQDLAKSHLETARSLGRWKTWAVIGWVALAVTLIMRLL